MLNFLFQKKILKVDCRPPVCVDVVESTRFAENKVICVHPSIRPRRGEVEKRSSGLDVREAVSFASIHVVEERVQRRFDYVEAKAE
jgi:hypothetical protein